MIEAIAKANDVTTEEIVQILKEEGAIAEPKKRGRKKAVPAAVKEAEQPEREILAAAETPEAPKIPKRYERAERVLDMVAKALGKYIDCRHEEHGVELEASALSYLIGVVDGYRAINELEGLEAEDGGL